MLTPPPLLDFVQDGRFVAVAHLFGQVVAACHFGLWTLGSVEFGEAGGWDSEMVIQCNSPSEDMVFGPEIGTARWC